MRHFILISFATVALLLGAACSSDDSSSSGSTPNPTATQEANVSTSTPEQAVEATAVPTTKELTYEEVDTDGGGDAILITPDYFNDADMTALGDKLKEDFKDESHVFLAVFTDRQAAALRGKVVREEASQAENDLYDQHYVGQYTKNTDTGFHEFTIYFDGPLGTNQKTIQY